MISQLQEFGISRPCNCDVREIYRATRDFPATGKFAEDRTDEALCIAKEHQSLVEVIKRVVDSGESCAHAALDHHHGARLVHIQDGHAEDRTARSVRAAGLVTSFAPIIRATSVCGNSPLMSSMSISLS